MTFHLFGSLPAELRQHIWQLTVYDDSPEVCLCWPSNLHLGYGSGQMLEQLPTLPLTVDLPFPVAMHVCRESRAAIQAQASLRWRSSAIAGCAVPFRVFRPDMDTLYLDCSTARLLEYGIKREGERAQQLEEATMPSDEQRGIDAVVRILRDTKHIALEWLEFYVDDVIISDWVWPEGWDADILLQDTPPDADNANKKGEGVPLPPSPRRLSYVVPSSRYVGRPNYRELFKQPGRRCKLEPLSAEAMQRVRVRDENAAHQQHRGLLSVATAVEESRAGIWRAAQQYGRYRYAGDGIVQPGKTVDITACTFVEYQRDGTWKESCHDRTWSPEASQAGAGCWVPGPPVPLQDRPDPEMVRVQDADVEFAPWGRPRHRPPT